MNYSEIQEKLLYIKTTNRDQHEKDLTSIECFLGVKLFLTSSYDGLVKVWNIKKQLIREVKFPDPISCVTFLNEQSDLLIGHLEKLSTIKSSDY